MVPDEPEIDACMLHVLQWFYALNAKRQSGLNGPLPISYTEMQSWITATRKTVWPDEVEAISEMDRAYLLAVSAFHEQQKDN